MLLARDKKRGLRSSIDWPVNSFYSISHDLLIAKLNAYGFDPNALNVTHSYLSEGSQETKAGSCFSDLLDIFYSVPQASMLVPIPFNINLCNLFLSECSSEFSNFADDTTPYESFNSEKFLGVTVDSKLSFNDHITNPCRKTSQILHALSRVTSQMSFDKKIMLSKTFTIPIIAH